MAASRPKASTSSSENSEFPWLLVGGAIVVLAGAGAAYALMSSGKKDEPKAPTRPTKTARKPKAVPAEAHSAAADSATDPAPVDPTPASEAPKDAPKDAEEAPLDLDLGSAAGAAAGELAAAAEAPTKLTVDADGCVTKEGLVIVLRGLTERIAERRKRLQEAVKDGALDPSDFERALGQAIPELEAEVNTHFGVDPEAVFNAQSKYQEEPEVVAVSRELRNAALPDFAAKAMGDMEDIMTSEGSVPEGMTEERVAQLTIDNATATIAKMKELVAEVKADGLSGSDALQAFQQRFVQRAKQYTLETFKSLGVSPEDYAACMMKFVESPAVQRAHQDTHQRLALCQQLNMMELTSGMSRSDAIASMGIPAEAAAHL